MKSIALCISIICPLLLVCSNDPYRVSDLEWVVLKSGIAETLPISSKSGKRMLIEDFYFVDQFDDTKWYFNEDPKPDQEIEAQFIDYNIFISERITLPEISKVTMIMNSSLDSIANVTLGGSGFWDLFNKKFEKNWVYRSYPSRDFQR